MNRALGCLGQLLLLVTLFGASAAWGQVSVPAGDVSGHITEDTIWEDTSGPYLLVGDLWVDAGVTLTISAGVTVQNTNSNYELMVYGTLTAHSATFEGNYNEIVVRDGGRLDLTDCTIPGANASIVYQGGSTGTLDNVTGPHTLNLNSGATLTACNNDFTATGVTASGDNSATFDLRYNYWGTTDWAEIEGKILHQVDDPNRPLVLFDPWLLVSPTAHLGFYVTGRTPLAYLAGVTDHIDLVFSQPPDLATLEADNLSLERADLVVPINSITPVDDTTCRMSFDPLTVAGVYGLTILTGAQDAAGHALNQDLDATPGEPGEDEFFAEYTLDPYAPRATGHAPAGDIAGTVASVEIRFSEPILASTFTVDDAVVLPPGGGTVAPTSIAMVTDSRYVVAFPGQTDYGNYTVEVGPNITDPAGNPMDQDENGTPGEPADVYAATFNLVDVDLTISGVTVGAAQLWAGDMVQVSWDGTNASGLELLGDWTDAAYLSNDDVWDIDDKLLGTVPHTGGLGAGDDYHQDLDVVIPGALPGDYYVIVRADLYNQEQESGGEGNNVAASSAAPLAVHPLPNDGTPVLGTLSAQDRFDYYAVDLEPAENIRLNLDGQAASGINVLYASRAAIPTPPQHEYGAASDGPDVVFTVPGSFAGGTYYVMVHAKSLATEHDYTLTGTPFEVILDRVLPSYCGNLTAATLTLAGDGFNETSTVEFIASDTSVYTPTDTTFVSSQQLLVDVDLPSWPVDVFDVRVTNAGGATSELTDAFTLHEGMGPQLEVDLIVPQRLGFHISATLWVEYENIGDAPMPAPMFVVHGSQHALMTADPAHAGPGLWTSSPPDYLKDTVMVWPVGSGSTPGTLQPGDSGRIPVYFRGLKQPWNWSRPRVQFSLGVAESTAGALIDWAAMKDDVRPEWVAPEPWDAMWTNFVTRTGEAWGELVLARSEILNYLAALGHDAAAMTFDEVLAFAAAEAADVGPSSYLASGVDAVTPAPGIPLVFSRVYNASFESRYRVGALGRGWSHNWEFAVEQLSNGDVILRGPGGADRHFTKEGVAFTPLPGDFGALTLAGGEYTLAEKDGTVWQFRPDNLLDYVEDRNGNRVTCAYTDGGLTELTHTNGDTLTIAYDGNGRIDTVTDPNGVGPEDDRVTTFSYDATTEYLLSSTTHDGRTTSYAYQTTGDITTLHALLSVTYPDDRSTFFEYDSQGRLAETHGDGDAQAVTYAYGPNRGTVAVTNAEGVASELRRGVTGQWSRVAEACTGNALRMTYDDAGQPTQVRGPQGEMYHYTYDASGNVTGLVDPLLGETAFSYNGSFNTLASVTDARANGIEYSYHANGDLQAITYEDGTHEDFTYYPDGLVETWTNRRGQQVVYTYNTAGQPLTKDYDSTPGVDYTYAYDPAGRLESATDATGTTGFDYDSESGWLTRIDYPGGRWFEFEYDDAGRRTKRTDQLDNVENYYYDAVGRLDRMTDAEALIVDYDYDAAGRVVRKELGNGVYTTYEFDSAGRLWRLSNLKPDATVLSRFEYAYDASGRVTSITKTYGIGDPRTSGTEEYGYDTLGQLTRVEYPVGRVVEYHYDAVGNRIEVVDDGVVTPYTTNDMNQYTAVGEADYTFDLDGNMTSKTEGGVMTVYTYNAENRLVMVERGPEGQPATDVWTYTYDGLGNRVGSSDNGVSKHYVIDPAGFGDLAAEYDGVGDLSVRYSHGHEILCRHDTADGDSFLSFSGLGNTTEVTGASGSLQNHYSYTPFGESLSTLEDTSNDFEYVGAWGVTTGIYGLRLMGARAYSPVVGRFTSADPLGIRAGDTNLYRYVGNAPTAWIDPSGMYVAGRAAVGPLINLSLAGDEAGLHVGVLAGFDFGVLLSKNKKVLSLYYVSIESQSGNFDTSATAVFKHGLMDEALMAEYDRGLFGESIPAGGAYAGAGFELDLFTIPWHHVLHGLRTISHYQRLRSLMTSGPDLVTQLIWDAFSDLLAQGLLESVLTQLVGSCDPNDKLTGGYGEERFVHPDAPIPYTIRFENKSTATAPAQRIIVTDVLDDNLDLDSLELTEIAFGEHVLILPAGLAEYETRVDLRPEGIDCVVDVAVALDRDTRTLSAELICLDPLTGWMPQDVDTGLLYPNDETGRGEGHISCFITPVAGLPSDTVIRNDATIVFDYNDAIDTPEVENRLDSIAPSSQVLPLPPVTTALTFDVAWSGQDGLGGSGLAGFDIYMQDDDGPWALWLGANTATLTSAFTGQHGHTYGFYSIAMDNVGHREPAPGEPDAVTLVDTVDLGSLLVTIGPAEVCGAGARWSIDSGGTWYSTGTTIQVTPGEYVVEFNLVEGWLTPLPLPVQVFDETLTAVAPEDGALYQREVTVPLSTEALLALVLSLGLAALVLRRCVCGLPKAQG